MKLAIIEVNKCYKCPFYRHDGVNGYCKETGSLTYFSGEILEDCPLPNKEKEEV